MTDRKLTCAACKSAITKGDIAGSDLEFGGELKATNQPEYTADADTDLVATVGTLDEYTPMVRTTGSQTIEGVKTFTGQIVSNFNKINRITEKISPAGEYIFAQIPSSADNVHRIVIDYTSRATGISKIVIDTNLSEATLTATAVYNSAQNVPIFNLYTDSNGTQYLGSTCVNNDIIEISGGTFHMRGSSIAQQLTFMSNFISATDYNKITNN